MQKLFLLFLNCVLIQSCYFHKSSNLIKQFQPRSITKVSIRFTNNYNLKKSDIDFTVNKGDSMFKRSFSVFDTLINKMQRLSYSKKDIEINIIPSREVNLRIYLYRNKDWLFLDPYLQRIIFSKPGGTTSIGRTYDIAYYSRESYYNDKALTNEFIILCNQIINIKNSLAKQDSLLNYSLPLFE